MLKLLETKYRREAGLRAEGARPELLPSRPPHVEARSKVSALVKPVIAPRTHYRVVEPVRVIDSRTHHGMVEPVGVIESVVVMEPIVMDNDNPVRVNHRATRNPQPNSKTENRPIVRVVWIGVRVVSVVRIAVVWVRVIGIAVIRTVIWGGRISIRIGGRVIVVRIGSR